jgi:site-specific recombinase XerD
MLFCVKKGVIMFKDRIDNYLFFCKEQCRLDEKTIRAYKIDLEQYGDYACITDLSVTKETLNSYIISLHKKYKQKTVKRKIASIKAFYNYYEREDIIEINPIRKISTKFREEKVLPKTIPRNTIEVLLKYLYLQQDEKSNTAWQKKILARNIAVIELLFATGLRISELCNLRAKSIDLGNGVLCIKGKGAKERYLQIGNQMVFNQLIRYQNLWNEEHENDEYFFHNRYGKRYSEQSARKMITLYIKQAGISLHVTPHMFRHSFATLLLEEEVDIRYIQKMLGHSSITTTQIYTEVTSKKQMEILRAKHPRNKMVV